MSNWEKVFYVVLGLFVIFLVCKLCNAEHECREKGGELVRTPFAYSCVKVEVVRES